MFSNRWLLKELDKDKNTCKNLVVRIDLAQKAMQNFMNTLGQANNCGEKSNGLFNEAKAMKIPEVCKNNPNLTVCNLGKIDCSNPILASNKVCVCSKTPNNPICLDLIENKNATQAENPTSYDYNSDFKKSAENPFGNEDIFGLPELQQGKINSDFSERSIDGKQGSGAMLGGFDPFGNGSSGDTKGGHKEA